MSQKQLIVKITDGFGNQLFQYAAGYSVAKKNNMKLYLDLSEYKENSFRKYELGKLNIVENFADEEMLCNVNNVYKERFFNYDSEIYSIHSSTILEGFWQSEKYFCICENDILEQFTFKDMAFMKNNHYLNMMMACNSVGIHVRTQDYLIYPDSKIHYVCTPQYYSNAVAEIRKIVDNPVFFVFSDNLFLAQKFLDDDLNYILVNSDNWMEDFYLMQKTKHNIIANSSFSWWAAWLNKNKDKIIIAPECWFSATSTNDYSDVVPDSWIKVRTQ